VSKKGKSVSDDLSDDDLLEQLGIGVELEVVGGFTAREERIIAGFEEIQRFVAQHGHSPGHGEGFDIFERLYAVRLDRLRRLPEARSLLAALDTQGLLTQAADKAHIDPEKLGDDDLLAELGIDANDAPAEDDITVLRHVKSRAEKVAAEDIANRTPCEDFDQFKPTFDEVEAGLKSGSWDTLRFDEATGTTIEAGDLFILHGQTVLVVSKGEPIRSSVNDRPDARLRVIYSNGTESNLLLRSLQRALYKDEAGRRLRKIIVGPLFSDEWEDGDVRSGTIYVLRSLSDEPLIAQHRQVIHKIGVTGGKVETRISDAENDPTYLCAPVEVVATYKLAGVSRSKVEGLLHKIFADAQFDMALPPRYGKPVRPQEWFLVPLPVIDQAVRGIIDGTILDKVYDRATGKLVTR
jgi:hypothetical protein